MIKSLLILRKQKRWSQIDLANDSWASRRDDKQAKNIALPSLP